MLYYMNLTTGEITENHKEAVQWFRDGANINLYEYDILAASWEH